MFGSSQKVIRTVARICHTFPKLGGGAMGSRFREQLTRWTDPTVFTQFEQWKGFLSAMVTAHGADILYMRNFLVEITKNKYSQGGLTLKDLKPDTFESNEKSKLSFRQWSDEFSKKKKTIDQDFERMLRLAAQMQQWDKDKFTAEAQQDYRLGAAKVAEFDKHIYLAMKRLTAGIAREIEDTCKTAGEAWYRLTDQFHGRNVQGATAIASQLQESKRPTQIAESFRLLNVIRHKSTETKLSTTTWKIRSLLSSETTHPALHQWILETLHQDRQRHQVLAVPVRVPRQAHTEGRTVIQT